MCIRDRYFTYKTAKIIKQKLASVSLLCKTAAFKQQISKFYPQILSTEVSCYIYDKPRIEKMWPLASVRWICEHNFYICCFKAAAFTKKRNWSQSHGWGAISGHWSKLWSYWFFKVQKWRPPVIFRVATAKDCHKLIIISVWLLA